jgi:hypothetical protein
MTNLKAAARWRENKARIARSSPFPTRCRRDRSASESMVGGQTPGTWRGARLWRGDLALAEHLTPPINQTFNAAEVDRFQHSFGDLSASC